MCFGIHGQHGLIVPEVIHKFHLNQLSEDDLLVLEIND